ncbi:MAG TPA: tRNA uridine-5-carboxymethylaminomethyl(34) synthesis GTPase MnmE [Planctomycetaceae bacterium]|nr:tRNA uridine-5-carboxymethylaminomethyl(34) synthesis GTPase MnmE [Planctomycetaceae bacterium]
MYSTTELDTEQTIAAIASPPGAGGRGIIRISGVDTLEVLAKFLREAQPELEIHRRIAQRYCCSIPFGVSKSPLPIALLVWPGTKSYTGQPTVEIHTIGSPPILESLLAKLYQWDIRPARPGEFTMRSVLAGKMSLLQAEAVLGVIDAESERELDQALTQLAGGISNTMRTMRDTLLSDLADLEAGLDFVDEDIDFVNRHDFLQRLIGIEAELAAMCESAERRMLNRVHFRVVLAGLPNAGKSTLFNGLTGQQALISDIAGTTTDYLSATVTHSGMQLEFLDTAGWELDQSGISHSAQIHRQQQVAQADLILWCSSANLNTEEQVDDESRFSELMTVEIPVVRIRTKQDLQGELPSEQCEIAVSVEKNTGIEEVWQLIADRYESRKSQKSELLSSSAARCRDALERARLNVHSARLLAETTAGDELIAEEIRGALRELGMILGQVHTDDLLDIVFSRFCIGK